MIAPVDPPAIPRRFLSRLMGDVRNNSLNIDTIVVRQGRVALAPRRLLHPLWLAVLGLLLGVLVAGLLSGSVVHAVVGMGLLVPALAVSLVAQIILSLRSRRGPWLVVDRAAGTVQAPREGRTLRLEGARLQLITAERTSETQICATELNLIAPDALGQWIRCGIAGVACEDDTPFRAMATRLAQRCDLPLRQDTALEAEPDGFEALPLSRSGLEPV